ncbi:MAG: glycosyltransferase family A protein [Planctomycetota bacterium]
MQASDPESDDLARALVEGAFGPIAVCGLRRAVPHLDALVAAASELRLVAGPDEIAAFLALHGETLAVETRAHEAVASGEAVPLAGLVALDWPPGDDPFDALEALLAGVADRGFVWLDLPATAEAETRLARALENLLDERRLVATGAGRVVVSGRRDAPGRELADEEPEPIDLTAIVYCRGDSTAANATVLDLLFRQNFPPHLVLVVDDAEDGIAPVPEDLWGMASWASTQPALVRGGGQGRLAALATAREFLETDAAVWIEAGDRLAANHLGALYAALLGEEEADFAIASGWVRAADGATRAWRAPSVPPRALLAVLQGEGAPPTAALAFRVEALDGITWPEGAESVFPEALATALAEEGRGVASALPLFFAAAPDVDDAAARTFRLARREREDLGRLALAHASAPRDERRARALADRARRLLAVGAAPEAREDLEAARALRPDDGGLALLLAAAALSRGDAGAALEDVRDLEGPEGAAARRLLGIPRPDDRLAIGVAGDLARLEGDPAARTRLAVRLLGSADPFTWLLRGVESTAGPSRSASPSESPN